MAELVGGAFLSASFQFLFDRLAKLVSGKNMSHKLRKLRVTMNSVEAVLDDAEHKQFTDRSVKKWYDDLKDAFYEAENLVDEIEYEALQLKIQRDSRTTFDQGCSCCVPCGRGSLKLGCLLVKKLLAKEMMDSKLKEMIETLEYIVKQIDVLPLKKGVGENLCSSSQYRIPSTSLLDESGVCGRDADKKAIMKLLRMENNGLDVIRIFGMGGIGKTTLTQFVYNDNILQELFDLKIWVCISLEFDVFRVIKDILKELGLTNCDSMTSNQLHLELEKKVKGKRFLLVLDDVWIAKHENWDYLHKPLKSGARGSKIIVTTRHESLANIMCTVRTHELKELEDDDCWILFVKHAFGDENSSVPQELYDIGREIVKRCKGLPLAVKLLGGLLHNKRDAKEWKKILESDKWNEVNDEILPALMLSYYYLPSHLKRCVAYCAVFPQDFKFDVKKLVLLWMAEGLIAKPVGNKQMKELGEEYFYDLVSRSFFQQSEYNCFVMHDLLNELAKKVYGEDDMEGVQIVKRAFYLSYIKKDNLPNNFESISKIKSLRSLYLECRGLHGLSEFDNKADDLLQKLHYLRILSFSECDHSCRAPNSIGHLKHLRYLNFEWTQIKALPESITSLYYLETLILQGCEKLVKLPADMVRLINLCHLDISGTKLQEMPPQMGELKKLQYLTDFFLGKNCGSSIKELGNLKHLKETLRIWSLDCVKDTGNASEAALEKKHLKEVELNWDGVDENSHHKDVLGKLKPHTDLEYLTICKYRSTGFPNWIGDSSFTNMISLKLLGCKYCSSLPPLGRLVSLKELEIEGCERVEVIGLEFYGRGTSTMEPFPSLESLLFKNMLEWREWISYGDEVGGGGGAFPLLKDLRIQGCPKLTETLPNCFPSLTSLEFDGCVQLMYMFVERSPILAITRFSCSDAFVTLEGSQSGLSKLFIDNCDLVDSLLKKMDPIVNFSTIQDIEITFCDSFECFPIQMFPNLSTLYLGYCGRLNSICSSNQLLPNFTSLRIIRCPNFISFPEGGLSAPNLKSLYLGQCLGLKSLPDCTQSLIPSLVSLRINDCPEVESFPYGGLPSKLERLIIFRCNKLIADRGNWNLQMLSSLSGFRIQGNEVVESFPEESFLPSSLTSLEIGSLRNLNFLDCKGLCQLTCLKKLTINDCHKLEIQSTAEEGLHHLTSLQELFIQSCRKIRLMPKEGLPSSLTELTIGNLPNLEYLDCKGLQQLTSLRELKIFGCPKLECIPHEGLPSSLYTLSIYECPMLEQKCEREKGEDWHKISHIPHIKI